MRLVPVRPDHLPALYDAAVSPTEGFRWRFRGRTPSPEEFRSTLYAGVKAQFAVEDQRGEPIGLVVAYDEDPACRHCHIAFLRTARAGVAPGGMVEGMGLLLAYLFETFPYEHVYFEVPEYNLPLIERSVEGLLTEEGRLTRYYWHAQRAWDRCFFSIRRDDWTRFRSALEAPPTVVLDAVETSLLQPLGY